MKLLLSLVDRYADSPEAALRLGEVLAEDRAILAQYLHGTCRLRPGARSGSRDDEERGDELKPALLEALLRNDFRAFLHKVFATLSPGQAYVRTWHVEAIAWRLERVRRGEIRRLIINMPPRSLKSIAASVAFPAFVLGHDPSRRIICVSYSGDLAKKHANDFRAVLESPWYRSAFPYTRIGPFKNSETEIELTARGFRLATSVGGTLTGRGGDIIVIDDPLKPDDALSETKAIRSQSMVHEYAVVPPRRQADRRDRGRHAARPHGRSDGLSCWPIRRMGGPQPSSRSPNPTRPSRFRLERTLSPPIGRGAVPRARAASCFGALETPDRQRRVLGSVSASAGAAGRRDGEAPLDQALFGTPARMQTTCSHCKAGTRPARAARTTTGRSARPGS